MRAAIIFASTIWSIFFVAIVLIAAISEIAR